MRNLIRDALFAAACGFIWCLASGAPVRSQTAEDIVQKQLGQLMIANANCSAQSLTASSELQKARAEIDDLKKQIAGKASDGK